MALLARLFSPRKNQKKEINIHHTTSQNKNTQRTTFKLEREQVRILLFRECDWRGRKLLFDSSSVQKVAVNNLHSNSRPRNNSKDLIFEVSNGFGYQYVRPSPDSITLGETVFGAVALSLQGPAIKIHMLHNPHRLMLSSVFHCPRASVRRRQISDRSLDDSYGSSINSISDFFSLGSSGDIRRSSFDCQENSDGSGNCESVSYCPLHCSTLTPHCNSTTSNGSNQSGGSLTSLRRRWLRSVTTSMDLDSLHNLTDIDPSQTLESNSSSDSTHNSQISNSRRTKLGVAVLISLQESQEQEMEQHLLERMPLLVHIITRLQCCAERAYTHKEIFVQLMMEASADTAQGICDMLCGFHIETPLWLGLTSKSQDNSIMQLELLTKLVKDLGYLLQTMDTKHTNFFMSTLLTAVLTHHLGWVPTILADDNKPKSSNKFCAKSDMLSALSQSHPYSPLWAQVSDLRGALGFPAKVSKTIIIGQSEPLVSKVLSILTYFIRCGQVYWKHEEKIEDSSEEELLSAIVGSRLDSTNNNDTDVDSGSFEVNSMSSSSSVLTLTKSKTTVNLGSLTESVDDTDKFKYNRSTKLSLNEIINNVANSKMNGFNKTAGLKRTLSCQQIENPMKVKSESVISEQDELNPEIILDKVTKLCRVPKSALLYHIEDKETVIENNSTTFIDFPHKIESEKQMASVDMKNLRNRQLYNQKDKISFLKDNLLQPSIGEDEKSSGNVVFVVGENEELANLKSKNLPNDKLNLPSFKIEKYGDCDNNTINFHPSSSQGRLSEDGESGKTEDVEPKTADNSMMNGRVLIVKPTPMDSEDCSRLSPSSIPLQRCLSIPDVAMLATESIKERRSRETVEIIRRWFSDSEITNIKRRHKHYLRKDNLENDKVNDDNVSDENLENILGIGNVNVQTIDDCSRSGPVETVDSSSDIIVRTDNVSVSDAERKDCFVEAEMEKPEAALKRIHLPVPNSKREENETEVELVNSLLGGVSDHYIPSLVLQGIVSSNSNSLSPSWEAELHEDLLIEAHSPVLNQEFNEAVCIVANIDTWEVQLVSSHTLVVEKIWSKEGRSMGMRVGMSQLVANMMETVLNLWKLSVPAKLCVSHIEAKLEELWIRSHALAEMLLSTEFLEMDTLTAALDLDPNDVPLLMSIASIHCPQVTRKYGLSFQ